jgi:hypothetical protein
MKHSCDAKACEHNAVKYCKACKNAYCEDCKEAWVEPCTLNHYATSLTSPYNPWTITYKNAITPENFNTAFVDCGHTQ